MLRTCLKSGFSEDLKLSSARHDSEAKYLDVSVENVDSTIYQKAKSSIIITIMPVQLIGET